MSMFWNSAKAVAAIHLHQSRSSIATSHSAIRFFAALLFRITHIMKSAGGFPNGAYAY